METVNLSTFNGFKVEVVSEGTKIRDVLGKKPEITIDDRTIGIAGHRLYCTETTWDRFKAGTEDKQADVLAEDSTVDNPPADDKPAAKKAPARKKASAK